MSSQNSLGVKGVIILLLFVIGIPLATFLGNQKMMNYQVNGTDVTAKVINVETLRIARKVITTVTATYTDKDGKIITAEVINPGSVSKNDMIVGKVVPENPTEVFLKPSLGITIIVYGIFGFCFLMGLIIIYGMVHSKNTQKQMASHSKVTDAVILSREQIGDATFVDIAFKDENGVHRSASCRVPDYMNANMSTCTIRYFVKSEKKVICEIV